ncbi:MAG TPA: hypothetical protein VK604_25660, partial [Bryobacteraceae bacterium]|nr:hypothetical protein [Bryobacteraceae bacterium]
MGEQSQPQAGLGLGDVYGIAPSDFTHKFLFNYSVDLPFGRGKKLLGNVSSIADKFIGGWWIAGTTTFRSGQPIQVYTPSGGVGGLGSAWYNIGQGRNQRPISVPGQQLGLTTDGHQALVGSANYRSYANPGAFVLPQGFELGNVPSTYGSWFGPGFSQWDMALMKEIGLGKESRHLQLQFEAAERPQPYECWCPCHWCNQLGLWADHYAVWEPETSYGRGEVVLLVGRGGKKERR